jgi:hypothetical protein
MTRKSRPHFCGKFMLKLFIWRMFRRAGTRCRLLMQVACGVVIVAGACLGRVGRDTGPPSSGSHLRAGWVGASSFRMGDVR